MTTLKKNTAFKNLLKKGFIESTKKAPDHKRLELYVDGKFVTSTKFSHNNDDIRDPLIKLMSQQCKLSKNEFVDLANCPLSKEEYLEILKSKDLLS